MLTHRSSTTTHPSPLLMVWLTGGGILVPRLDAPPELLYQDGRPQLDRDARSITVDGAGLRLLERLTAEPAPDVVRVVDEVAVAEGAPAEVLDALVGELEAGGLLFPVPPSGAATATGAVPDEDPDDQDGVPDVSVGDGPWVCPTPLALLVRGGRFLHLDHSGRIRASLDAELVSVLAAFAGGRTVVEAHEVLAGSPIEQVRDAAVHLASRGLLRPHHAVPTEQLRAALQQKFEAFSEADDALLAVLDAEIDRAVATGVQRPVVVPVDAYDIPMLSLGMVVAYARAHDGGSLEGRFGFAPPWYTRSDRVRGPLSRFGDHPAVFLFSHYTWTERENLELSAMVKQLVPRSITVHGGPNAPKYEGDVDRWFEANPHVDVVVHGEGEVTLAELLEALVPARGTGSFDPADLSTLAEVAGLSFRTPRGVQRTADRERIADLDALPSPYLTGLFPDRRRWQWGAINLETNRGCPYGCTFCDWGSATLSRIRKFDLDRVKAEMEWAARNEFEVFSLTDANFGIFERDLEIAEWAVELHRRHGFPTAFQVNYAKNRVGNLAQIVKVLADAGILTEGLVAVQTFDPGVLKTIKRSNIKQDRYDALTSEFRQAGLPLYTDVMVGLPGSTPATVRGDFQSAIDRELHVKAHPTQLLVNSPMNDPAYRAEHGIVAAPGEHVEQTTSYTHDEWIEMMAMRRFFFFAERRGILRQVATYTRAESGCLETVFYDRVREAGDDPFRWPQLAYLTRVAPDEYVPPGSWWPMLEELGRFCVEEVGVPDDGALRTVLVVQHAVLPAGDRRFPFTVSLDHDYAAWHDQVIAAKRQRPDGTWTAGVPPLREFGPADFVVLDRDRCCERVVGQTAQGALGEVIWELDSPVTRPKQLA
jgi:radical SAM superfamily enzyme YgiQ (UPF0313 family)